MKAAGHQSRLLFICRYVVSNAGIKHVFFSINANVCLNIAVRNVN